MKGVYPCILVPEELGGFSVLFPDFGGATQGETLYEALEMAEDFLGFAVTSAVDNAEEIPAPTPLKDIVIEDDGAFVSWIKFDTDAYKKILTKSENATGAA